VVTQDEESDARRTHAGEGNGRATLAKSTRFDHHWRVTSVAALKSAVPPRYKRAARRAYLRVAAIANAGSGVECSCCGKELRRFARFHGERDQCSGCGSLMRERALLLLLHDRLGLPGRGGRVIDIGPSSAVAEWFTHQTEIDYVSVDVDSPVAVVRADATDLPFAANSFDVAVCVHTLEHIPDDRQALREIHRVLRPGGHAVLQVPPSDLAETREDPRVADPVERERLFGQYDHVRLCGADYPERIAEAGFEVERVDFVETLPPEPRRRYGLRLGEPFDLGVKPAANE
jgi:SAM-dependent methyltransferase